MGARLAIKQFDYKHVIHCDDNYLLTILLDNP